MFDVMVQMAALILCGVVWRLATPGGQDALAMRTALTSLVYYLLLPALVLLVLWEAPLGTDSFKIALVAAVGILASLLVTGLVCRLCGMSQATRGAVMLAASFPNATYLGLPVLVATLGLPARSIAIQYDLFACMPLLLTVGIWVAAKHGSNPNNQTSLKGVFKVPALWAAGIAVMLNLSGMSMPEGLNIWLKTLSNGVVPLMLISLGLSLHIKREQLKVMRSLIPALGIKLLFMPLVVFGLAKLIGMEGLVLKAVVLEAAMPSMVIGLLLCDRYGLDSSLYAAIVTLSTVISFFSLGMWFSLV
ncbi:MAG: AEC family transporter [Gammaproteobacteria bacterium]|nr:AEC family transporter [Gammaproteobacteria bacterium]MDH5594746.1 AEC family transporter [Gammaproteobacteria bacterium]